MSKNIVVLGGGYSGVLTAKHVEKLIRKNKKQSEFKITLIDKNPYHTMLTELHEVAANRVDEDSIKMDLKKIFAGRNVDVVVDSIGKIDFEANKLEGTNKTYSYDYLVLGSGSKPAFFGVSGATENAFTLWSFDDAVRLKEHFLTMFREASRETDKAKRQQMLSFFVVGGGFTGVEMMGELAEWLPRLCADYYIDRSEVTLTLVDMLDRILMALPEHLANRGVKRFEKMGVKIMTKTGVVKVDGDAIELKIGDKVDRRPTNTVIWAAGIEGSSVVSDSDIPKQRGKRVETDEFLRAKGHENVYVVGDNIFFTPPGEKMAVPQMVENAEASSKLAAHNLATDLFKKGEKEKYAPKFHGMMVCIGGRFGVAYVGTHTKKFGLGSFFAMLSKHFINIIYFIQVLGWNKIWNYICHEFFKVKDNRSFVGGHLANGGPAFWQFPLRLLLGFYWIIEFLGKFPNVLSNPKGIFLFKLPAKDGVDAVTSASTTFTYVEGFPAGIGKFLDSVVSRFAIPAPEVSLPVPAFITSIMDWAMGVFVAPIAPFVQGTMVCVELVIGACLVLGLFTSCAAFFSVVFCVLIYCSGMSGPMIIWYLTAGLALVTFGGSGQVLALDYYILPWLKKQWTKVKWVKKLYVYND